MTFGSATTCHTSHKVIRNVRLKGAKYTRTQKPMNFVLVNPQHRNASNHIMQGDYHVPVVKNQTWSFSIQKDM